jgi:hypothetical protein
MVLVLVLVMCLVGLSARRGAVTVGCPYSWDVVDSQGHWFVAEIRH